MSTRTAPTDYCDIPEATRTEGRELFDNKARQLLGISGDDFLAGWDRGEYAETEDPKVNAVAVLIPFAR